MKRLARLFALLALLALFGAAALLWVRPVPQPPPLPLPPLSGPVDLIVVEKAARRMLLLQDGQPVRSYRVALGFSPDGDKLRQGDGRTPEGHFTIDRRNDQSAYHLSLGLDYPQPEDRARAKAAGYDPGGDIMIHGQPNQLPEGFVVKGDWTAGCIAVTNAEMREIWAHAPTGTPVEIRP
ncbi:L,D-transpeptidase family protein [Rhodobacter sp. Har01]|uniref:L,D-transpeptidase family protein n=1 Tax=Rhodobacter sp. Har01 TaxID=2883999 RepID=UPI001D08D04D|nr:L,D-transpeptidase family protein [Rhodobacter sp. Har01]MCB6177684.1 L,D-transpeptidase family protein [Rhodobacter sp. Har01]